MYNSIIMLKTYLFRLLAKGALHLFFLLLLLSVASLSKAAKEK